MSRRRLIGVLTVLLCLPAVTIAWLGYRLLEQDRTVERQRAADTRELAVSQAVHTLSAILADPTLLVVVPRKGALLGGPRRPLLYHEDLAPLPEAPSESYAKGERLEFQHSAAAAIEVYRRQAKSSDPLLRAGALYRLARCLNKVGRQQDALQAYTELTGMEASIVDGWPAPIAAVWGRCRLFESSGNQYALRQEAVRLRELLFFGRYRLSRTAYAAFAEDVARWAGTSRPLELESLTEAVNRVEREVRDGTRPASGRAVVPVQSSPTTVVWGQISGELAVFAASPSFVEHEWLSRVGPGVWLRDETGETIGAPVAGQTTMRYAVESSLPWNIMAVGATGSESLTARRNLLLFMLAAVGLFTVAGVWVVVQAMRREFALARMQEDFVAAVSHEFRTPLTTLRQMTEALEDGRVSTEERRLSYYRSVSRATQRLHRLVEDLLDFRRLQSGAVVFRRARINVQKFTMQVVSDFEREAVEHGFEVRWGTIPRVEVLADREALSRALWNLLDNAMKYSGEARSVELETQCRGRYVEWSVRDHGFGIPDAERHLVFQKFYRGEGARHAGIRGTGIGLAIVQQIVAAHGGHVSVLSHEGEGSVFTISIPCEPPLCNES